MYVIDLFKELNTKEIVNRLCEFPNFFQEIEWNNQLSNMEKITRKNLIKEMYIDEIEKIKQKDIVCQDDGFIVVNKRIDSEEEYYDTSFIDLKERQKYLDCINTTNLDEFKNPFYSIFFMDRNSVLSYKLSSVNVNRMGKLLVAATILKDITTHAISEEENFKLQEIIKNDLEIQIDEIENEQNKTVYFSLDDLYKELGIEREIDTRTKEEKELEYKKHVEQLHNEIKNIINELKEIIQIDFLEE